MIVRFHESAKDASLKYAVIVARHKDKWVFCKHRERTTLELPGGHRESGEEILAAAKRELQEETGALEFMIKPLCPYSVVDEEETFGMLFFAEIETFEPELHSEIERIFLLEDLPDCWTYPQIQPLLVEEYLRRQTAPMPSP